MESVVPPGRDLDDLWARLRELEDKQALASLINRYIRAVDSFDYDAWGECWAEDAIADMGRGDTLVGREAIIAASRSSQSMFEDSGGVQHVIVNLEFEVHGDVAEGSGNLLFASSPDSVAAPPNRAIGGKYRWTFVRGPHGWLIAHTQLHRTWTVRRAPSVRV
jgi:ketosteroid isomerase-like protein